MKSIFVLGLSFACAVIATPFDERIRRGFDAQRHQFPYQVSYQVNNLHYCGGSILTEDWVLTAAHCTIYDIDIVRVVAGVLNLGENHPDVKISSIQQQIIHPDYKGWPSPNDLALLHLKTPLRWTTAVKPIRLPHPNAEYSGTVWLTGWGILNETNLITPTTLQYVQMNLIPTQECIRLLEVVEDSMVCTLGHNTGVCPGDSGGPMMQNGEIIGVASFYKQPCGSSLSIYTRVSSFISWIKKYVNI